MKLTRALNGSFKSGEEILLLVATLGLLLFAGTSLALVLGNSNESFVSSSASASSSKFSLFCRHKKNSK